MAKFDESDFADKVVEALKAAGVDAKRTYESVTVAGVKFEVERSKKPNRLRFAGSGFKIYDDNSFDVGKAAGLVVAQLPEKLAHKAKQDRAAANREEAHKLAAMGGAPVKAVYDNPSAYVRWLTTRIPSVTLAGDAGGIILRFRGTSEQVQRVASFIDEMLTAEVQSADAS